MVCFRGVKAFIYGLGLCETDIGFNDKIVEIGKVSGGDEIAIPKDAVVLPGFFDIHIHGANGSDVMDGNLDSLNNMACALLKEGTTRFLPTTMTQSEQKIENAVRNVAEFKKNNANGAEPMGVHLEGPFLSATYMGAQPPEFLKDPNISLFERWQSVAEGLIKTVTVAPELKGAERFVKYLVKKGVYASVGHSAATHEQMKSAIRWGVTRVTHTFNAQSPLKHREIGVAGTALLYDELYTELIADCVHVSVPAIKLLMKCKPKDKLILITDALRAKGLADGESELGGQKVFVKNGEARLADGTLAGSVLKMNVAIKNLTEQAGADFLDAVNCATVNPATALGYSDLGKIRTGNLADFTVLGKNYEVLLTIRDGKVLYRA